MKAALPHVRHVQKSVTSVQTNVRDSREWNYAKNCAGLALMLAANVQKNAGMVVVSQHNNVRMPVAPVRRNAKNIRMNIVSVVQRSAGNVKQNVERLLLNFLFSSCYILVART